MFPYLLRMTPYRGLFVESVRFRNYIDVRNLLLELEQLLDLRRCVSVRSVIRRYFRLLLLLRLRLRLRSRSRLMPSLSWRGSRNRRRGLHRVLRFRLSLRACLTIVRPPVHPVTAGIVVLERFSIGLISIVSPLDRGLTVSIDRPLHVEGGRSTIRGPLNLEIRMPVRSTLDLEVAVTVGRALNSKVSLSPSLTCVCVFESFLFAELKTLSPSVSVARPLD